MRPQLLVLACCRVCWALPDRQRAGGRRARCVLKMRGRELTTVVGFVARLRCVEAGARGVAVWPHPRVSGCELPLLWCLCESWLIGGGRVGGRWGGAYALL